MTEQLRHFLMTLGAYERFITKHDGSDLPHMQAYVELCKRHRAELLELL